MVSNNVLSFSVGLLGFILQHFIQRYAYQSHLVAYAFLVPCFESATIVAYVGLRVNTSLKNINIKILSTAPL